MDPSENSDSINDIFYKIPVAFFFLIYNHSVFVFDHSSQLNRILLTIVIKLLWFIYLKYLKLIQLILCHKVMLMITSSCHWKPFCLIARYVHGCCIPLNEYNHLTVQLGLLIFCLQAEHNVIFYINILTLKIWLGWTLCVLCLLNTFYMITHKLLLSDRIKDGCQAAWECSLNTDWSGSGFSVDIEKVVIPIVGIPVQLVLEHGCK